jgi:hypothetical protein
MNPLDLPNRDPVRPFGGLSPAEARARRTEKERERKAQAEQDALLDKLVVRARLATITASTLTAAELRELIEGLKRRAKGDGHVANQAAQQLLTIAREAIADDPDDPKGVSWDDMTREQRAAARAALERHIVELAGLPESEEQPTEGE